jgi:phosphomannomutase
VDEFPHEVRVFAEIGIAHDPDGNRGGNIDHDVVFRSALLHRGQMHDYGMFRDEV